MTDFPLPGAATPVVVAPAPGHGPQFWTGAPSAVLDGDTIVLGYRTRNGPDTTDETVIAVSDDGERYETVLVLAAGPLRRAVDRAPGARAHRGRLAAVGELRHAEHEALVHRGHGGADARGAGRRGDHRGLRGRRGHRRQGPDHPPHRRRVGRVDLLPPARRAGRRGPHEHARTRPARTAGRGTGTAPCWRARPAPGPSAARGSPPCCPTAAPRTTPARARRRTGSSAPASRAGTASASRHRASRSRTCATSRSCRCPAARYRIWYEARLEDESHELRTELIAP